MPDIKLTRTDEIFELVLTRQIIPGNVSAIYVV